MPRRILSAAAKFFPKKPNREETKTVFSFLALRHCETPQIKQRNPASVALRVHLRTVTANILMTPEDTQHAGQTEQRVNHNNQGNGITVFGLVPGRLVCGSIRCLSLPFTSFDRIIFPFFVC